MQSIIQSKSPIFILGCQRSGTNFLYYNLENDERVKGYNEDSPEAFVDFILKSSKNTYRLIHESDRPVVLFKSITNSLRADSLLRISDNARIIWIYRNVAQVVESHYKEFGVEETKRSVESGLSKTISGANILLTDLENNYPGSRLSDDVFRVKISGFVEENLNKCNSVSDLVALNWLLINKMFLLFDFHQSSYVKLVKYERLLKEPEKRFSELGEFCGLLKFKLSTKARQGISIEGVNDISEPIMSMCEELREILDEFEAGSVCFGSDPPNLVAENY